MLKKMIKGLFDLICRESSPAITMSTQDFLAFIKEKKDRKISIPDYEKFYLEFFNNISSVKKPEMIILGGGPGSGKTTYRLKHLANLSNFYTHDMDEILVLLSGYQEDFKTLGALKAFENWWPTAQKAANLLVQYAFKNKVNVIYDRTCGSDESFKNLKDAITKQGYTAQMFAFWVPEETAMQRVKVRGKEEGRTVSKEIIKEYRRRFATLFPQYMKMISEVTVLNDGEVIMQKTATETKIINPVKYSSFLEDKNE